MNMHVFYCLDAKLSTLPDLPTYRAATTEQLVEHDRRLKERNADEVLRRFGPDPGANARAQVRGPRRSARRRLREHAAFCHGPDQVRRILEMA